MPSLQSSFLLYKIINFQLFFINLITYLSFSSSSSCPPFISPPSFPLGYSHQSFQIHCSINNFSFPILHHQSNHLSISLNQSNYTSTHHSHCSNFSLNNSPFKFSHSSCFKLSVPRQCLPLRLPNCSRECPPFKLVIQIESNEIHHSYLGNCKICHAGNGICGFKSTDSTKSFVCLHQARSQISSPWIYRDNPNRIVILCTVAIVSCLVLVIVARMLVIRCKGMKSMVVGEDPTTVFLHRHCSIHLLPPVFSFQELESATNMFNSRRKIGDGGFGSVYLGELYDGRIVAVKVLHRNPSASMKSFCNEILILSSIDHPNLVKLHGYCSDPRGLLLVYDYVSNGTLADHLHGSKSLLKKGSLTWQVRVEVALQTAVALEYLHFKVEPAIVHRDITSSNIFVEKDMKIKVGDFGLSRLLIFSDTSSTSSSSSGFVCTGPQGTPGYLDPEYHHSFRLTEKSDVYSFGVILFELISGMKAVDLSRAKQEIALVDLVVGKIQVGLLHQVLDPVLIVEGEFTGAIDAIAELAFQCVAADKDDRPNTKEIVTELKRIKNHTHGCRNSNVVVPELSKV
ncbi:hypothetical protein C5167_029186 [Papaver somniferum]|uniref:LEAF RUST 10 DISEASE-RESISTANCE LOCUS RECEPTOR-LIKE PROTEIN KINASE-like 1.5 n=1 Tax=Papaver somniferum TaxID=3469 RepID=UPI000E6FA597|nr:LEAF RUST 10 DISEASE-RESISTANCE LOCUS RECEPTOR-LIKE PROTEIN KINASE-like 1.5 [Papaver somniferum]RZC93209.1 hypothetical protein C5167_029186 [Papaver somniferum]